MRYCGYKILFAVKDFKFQLGVKIRILNFQLAEQKKFPPCPYKPFTSSSWFLRGSPTTMIVQEKSMSRRKELIAGLGEKEARKRSKANPIQNSSDWAWNRLPLFLTTRVSHDRLYRSLQASENHSKIHLFPDCDMKKNNFQDFSAMLWLVQQNAVTKGLSKKCRPVQPVKGMKNSELCFVCLPLNEHKVGVKATSKSDNEHSTRCYNHRKKQRVKVAVCADRTAEINDIINSRSYFMVRWFCDLFCVHAALFYSRHINYFSHKKCS